MKKKTIVYEEVGEEGSEMSYRYEEAELHECCAVDCAEAGTEFLIVKSWAENRYGAGDERSTHHPVASGYYCMNHMAEKLESLTRRYRTTTDTKTTVDAAANAAVDAATNATATTAANAADDDKSVPKPTI
jgi:hypothetical protein